MMASLLRFKRGKKSYNKAASKDRFSDERLFGNEISNSNCKSPKVPGFFEIGIPRPSKTFPFSCSSLNKNCVGVKIRIQVNVVNPLYVQSNATIKVPTI